MILFKILCGIVRNVAHSNVTHIFVCFDVFCTGLNVMFGNSNINEVRLLVPIT